MSSKNNTAFAPYKVDDGLEALNSLGSLYDLAFRGNTIIYFMTREVKMRKHPIIHVRIVMPANGVMFVIYRPSAHCADN